MAIFVGIFEIGTKQSKIRLENYGGGSKIVINVALIQDDVGWNPNGVDLSRLERIPRRTRGETREETREKHSNQLDPITHVLDPHTHNEVHDPKSTKEGTKGVVLPNP
jgi:hypothetical protein